MEQNPGSQRSYPSSLRKTTPSAAPCPQQPRSKALSRGTCAGDLPRTLSQEAPGKLEVLPGRGGWARQDGKAKQSRETGTDARKASPRTSRCLSVNWEGFSVFKVLLESLGLMSLSKPQEAVKDREAGALQSMGVTKNRTRLSA